MQVELRMKVKPLHAGQRRARLEMNNNGKPYRNRVYLCGRRWGKTTELKKIAYSVIEKGYRIGLFCPEFKDIAETWEAVVGIFEAINNAAGKQKVYHIDKQAQLVRLITDGDPADAPCFECWTLANIAKQESGRGRKYNVVIYEETQKIDGDILKHHYEKVTIATLSDYCGLCFFIGTPPNSKLHYFYQLICKGAANNPQIANSPDFVQPDIPDPDFYTYRAPTSDNPFIHPLELERIQRTLTPLIYQQEYEAFCVEYTNHPFCHALQEPHIHNKVFAQNKIAFNPNKSVYIGIDFNKHPMAVVICQSRDPKLEWHAIQELGFKKGEKGSIYDICELIRYHFEFVFGYKLRKNGESQLPFDVFITGDATGNTDSAYRMDNLTFYDILCKELGLRHNSLLVPKINPRHTQRHAQINELFVNHKNILIAKESCPRLYGDLINTSCLPDLGIDKKKYDPHFFDAYGYLLSAFLPFSIRGKF